VLPVPGVDAVTVTVIAAPRWLRVAARSGCSNTKVLYMKKSLSASCLHTLQTAAMERSGTYVDLWFSVRAHCHGSWHLLKRWGMHSSREMMDASTMRSSSSAGSRRGLGIGASLVKFWGDGCVPLVRARCLDSICVGCRRWVLQAIRGKVAV
jgi:hypothetical protein